RRPVAGAGAAGERGLLLSWPDRRPPVAPRRQICAQVRVAWLPAVWQLHSTRGVGRRHAQRSLELHAGCVRQVPTRLPFLSSVIAQYVSPTVQVSDAAVASAPASAPSEPEQAYVAGAPPCPPAPPAPPPP